MANNLTGWLTIDRLNGEGNSVVTLTASTLATLGERNASLKIKTSSKEAIINLYQQHYEEPLIPDNIPNNQIWAKSTDGDVINSINPNSRLDVNLIEAELRTDGWSILTFDGDITYIPSRMFYDFYTVKEVVIPKSAQYIGEDAFYDCRGLESIYIPEGVTSIGNHTFAYCPFYNIAIPDSVTSIGSGAFAGCSRLTSIDLGNGVTSIRSDTFAVCKSLTSITIPDSVTSIGDSAFSNCKNLATITIPNSVTTIGANVFQYCESLTEITIPNSVTSIGLGSSAVGPVFAGCKNLSIIRCKARIAPTVYPSTFFAVPKNKVLEYPSGSDYSSWLRTDEYYLGYYNWTAVPF